MKFVSRTRKYTVQYYKRKQTILVDRVCIKQYLVLHKQAQTERVRSEPTAVEVGTGSE
jgi:hypothetical protein